jgi:Ubiquitin-activating enzyme E1 FCCH domain
MDDLGFLGFVTLGQTLQALLQTRNPSGFAPINADELPTWRVYGQTGIVQNGTAAKLQSGSITNATNVNPIVITSAGHGLVSGSVVTIAGVGGNTNANGTWVVTVIDQNTFSIPATGNSAYTSGGTWNATGLYSASIAATALNGYASGVTYTIEFSWTVSSANQCALGNFTVT